MTILTSLGQRGPLISHTITWSKKWAYEPFVLQYLCVLLFTCSVKNYNVWSTWITSNIMINQMTTLYSQLCLKQSFINYYLPVILTVVIEEEGRGC